VLCCQASAQHYQPAEPTAASRNWRKARRRAGQPRLARRATPRLRGPQPALRDLHWPAGHLACSPRQRRRP